jgi:hypothetical protein
MDAEMPQKARQGRALWFLETPNYRFLQDIKLRSLSVTLNLFQGLPLPLAVVVA